MEYNLTQITFLAATVWAIVETVKPLWDKEKLHKSALISLLVGLVVSALVNVFAGLDVFTQLGIPLNVNFPAVGRWVGVVLTGMLMSRGATWIQAVYRILPAISKGIPEIIALSKLNK